MNKISATPFVKWAGGKRQLIYKIKDKMPNTYNKYFEPFVGGGAVFFEIQPSIVTINDINKALINAYKQIQNYPEEFYETIQPLDENIKRYGKEFYYETREKYNNKLIKKEYDLELAATFVFLNKHCFNGLYRVNKKGLFNVPYNNSTRPSCTYEDIMNVSMVLENVTIEQGDFERICDLAGEGDFVFLDSPYAPINSTSFESYTKDGFDKESHIRLANTFKEMTERGCYCMLTNHNTKFINDLYSSFNIEDVNVKRMINSDANNRVGKEVIITNY